MGREIKREIEAVSEQTASLLRDQEVVPTQKIPQTRCDTCRGVERIGMERSGVEKSGGDRIG